MFHFFTNFLFCFLKKYPIHFLCFIFIFNGIIELNAQARYRGILYKAKNNKPAIGARLHIHYKDGVKETTYTDFTGRFNLYTEENDTLLLEIDDKRFQPLKFTVCPYEYKVIIVEKRIKKFRPKSFNFLDAKNNYHKTTLTFEKSEISNPSNAALLLQHKVPGLTVARSGNNPNEHFQLYNRGISSALYRNTPLIIIDGIPQTSLERFAPEDIASIGVIKNAAGGAQYGLFGGAGIIEVQTMRPDSTQPIVRYHSSLGMATAQKGIPIMGTDEFLQYKPNQDLGASTDWVNEISQTGVSHRHHLAFSKGTNLNGIYASLGYQDEKGILKQSGFQQGNARLNFRGNTKDGRRIYTITTAFTQRDADWSYPEAWRHAIRTNPTFPVYEEDGQFTSQGFNQGVNPLGTIKLSKNISRTREWLGSIYAQTYLDEGKSWDYQLSYRKRNLFVGRISPKSTTILFDQLIRNHFLGKILFNNQHKLDGLMISRQTGLSISAQLEKHQDERQKVEELNELNFKSLQNPESVWSDLDYDTEKYHAGIMSAFTDVELGWNIFNLFGGLRYDKFYLDNHHFGNLFFHAGIDTDLKKILEFHWLNKVNLTLGFGKTGNLLVGENEISNLNLSNYLAGEYLPINRVENQDVVGNVDKNKYICEYKKEIDLQLNASLFDDQLKINLSLYDNHLFGQHLSNYKKAEIGNKGIEAFFSYQIKIDGLRWQVGASIFTNKTILYKLSENNVPQALESKRRRYREIWIEPYKQSGQFQGFITDGSIVDGKYAPVLGPGNIRVIDIIGQTKPRVGFSIINEMKWKNWDLTLKLRSMIGHSLYNLYRNDLEVVTSGNRNIVKTKYFDPRRTVVEDGHYDVFMENASFLKCDYLSIGFQPNLKKGSIRFYLASHDLFTITSFTGIDPEPIYHRDNVSLAGGFRTSENYYRSRQFVFGVQFFL